MSSFLLFQQCVRLVFEKNDLLINILILLGTKFRSRAYMYHHDISFVMFCLLLISGWSTPSVGKKARCDQWSLQSDVTHRAVRFLFPGTACVA